MNYEVILYRPTLGEFRQGKLFTKVLCCMFLTLLMGNVVGMASEKLFGILYIIGYPIAFVSIVLLYIFVD